MTREELRNRLLAGETLDSIFRFRHGQECLIFKAEAFSTGDEILYVPDIDLNELPVDKDLSADVEGVFDVLEYCYTGKDFIDLCDGDEEFAKELFDYVDWQHPSSAYDEVYAEREEDKEWEEAHGAKWPHLK